MAVNRNRALCALSVCFLLIVGLLSMGPRIVPIVRAADPSPIIGDWEGTLDPGAQPKKKVVVHITATPDGILSGTIDYPDESVSGVLITAIQYKEPALHFENSSGGVSFDGTMTKGNLEITGTWKQGAAPLSLTLKKVS